MADLIERILFPTPSSAVEEVAAEIASEPAAAVPLAGIDDELVLTAKHRLTLRCGKSSITLYANGKIVLRGEYILSDAEGTNRINGGRIELN